MSEQDQDRYEDPEARDLHEAGAGIAAEPVGSFPWPPTENESIITAFGRTWTGASLRPRRFFALLPERGSLGAALLYYLTIGIAVAGATLFWRMLLGAPDTADGGAFTQVGLGGSNMNPLVEFLLSPLLLLLSLFLAAGVTHLLLLLFGGAHRDFAFTTRLFCFAASPQLIGVVPKVGEVIGFIWMVVVAIIGLREGHRTTTFRAAAAVLVPVFIALAFMAMAMLVLASGAIVPPR